MAFVFRIKIFALFALALLCAVVPVFAQPDNDLFANAQPLIGDKVEFKLFLGQATFEPGEPEHIAYTYAGTQRFKDSVWFTWTPSKSGIADIWIADFIPVIFYTGNRLEALTPAPASSGGGWMTFLVQGGVEYHIAFGPGALSDWTTELNAKLRLLDLPTNDAFAAPIQLSSNQATNSAVLRGTLETGEPGYEAQGASSSWWRWIPESNGTANVSASGTFRSGSWYIFEGDNLGSLRLLRAVSVSERGNLLVFPVSAGKVYRLALVGMQELVAAVWVSPIVAPLILSTPNAGEVHVGDDVLLNFDLLPSPATTNAGLFVDHYSGEWLQSRETLQPPFPRTFMFTNLPAGTNRIVLRYNELISEPSPRYIQYSSDFLVFRVAHPNDNFADAQLLVGTNIETTAHFINASIETNEIPASSFLDRTVWFKWVAPISGILRATSPFPIDVPFFELFTGNALTNLQSVASSIDYRFGATVFRVTGGTTYFLRVSSSDQQDSIRLNLSPPPENDLFANADELTAESLVLNLADASNEAGEPNASESRTIWFKFRPGQPGYLWTEIRSGMAEVRVYEGDTLEFLALRSHTRLSTTGLEAGHSYYIQVSQRNDAFGEATLYVTFSPSPPNDHFANRSPITLPFDAEMEFRGASIEQGEPDLLANNASVWFSWLATEDGFLFMWPAYLVSVWQGASLDSLTRVQPFTSSSGLFPVRAGERYNIRALFYRETQSKVPFSARFFRPQVSGDDFSNPMLLNGVPDFLTFVPLFRATESTNDPLFLLPSGITTNLQNTIWLSWTAPETGKLTLDVVSQTEPLAIAAYLGDMPSTLQLVTNGQNHVEFWPAKGARYRILIGGLPSNAFANSTVADLFAAFSTLHLTKPAMDDVYLAGESFAIALSAAVAGVDPIIDSVQFYSFERIRETVQELGSRTAAPYVLPEVSLAPGNYTLGARVFLETGRVIYVDLIPIVVRSPDVPHDQFAAARTISGRFYENTLTTNELRSATLESGEPVATDIMFATHPRGTLWYRWTAPASGLASASSAPAWGTEGAFYTGTQLRDLVAAPRATNRQAFEVIKGQEYFIQLHVGSTNSARWRLELSTMEVTAPLSYQEFTGGEPISYALQTTELLEEIRSVEILWNGHVAVTLAAPPWSATLTNLAPAITNLLTVLTTRAGERITNTGPLITVYPENSLPGLAALLTTNNMEVNFNTFRPTGSYPPLVGPPLYFRYTPKRDEHIYFPNADLIVTNLQDHSYVFGLQSAFGPPVFKLLAGVDYLFTLQTPRETKGRFLFAGTPVNDNFADALPLPPVDAGAPDFFWPVTATLEPGEPPSPNQRGSVWFRYRAPQNGFLDLSGGDVVRVFRGTNLTQLVEIPGRDAHRVYPIFPVEANVDYRIAVYSEYQFDLGYLTSDLITGDPGADSFADAAALTNTHATVNALYLDETYEPGEPEHFFGRGYGSIWWKWVPPSNGQTWIRLNSPYSAGTKLVFYSGTALTNLARVEPQTFGWNYTTYETLAGKTYYLALEVLPSTDPGIYPRVSFEFRHFSKPVNDQPFNALPVTSGSTVYGSHVLATRDPGEPLHGASYGGHSVWYRWRAEQGAMATITTRHGYLNGFGTPLLAVYNAESLQLIEGEAASASTTNHVSFRTAAGEEYLIAVDFLGGTAEFELEIDLSEIPLSLVINPLNGANLEVVIDISSAVLLQSSTNLVDWANLHRFSADESKQYALPNDGRILFVRAVREP